MKTVMRTLGWIGMISLYAMVLIILIVQWMPSKWMSFHDLFPSTTLHEYAVWGAIILAVLSVLILLKYRANETQCTWMIRIRYFIFAILLAGIGGFLGYAGVIKAGEAAGNFILKDSMAETSVQVLVKEKQSTSNCETSILLETNTENTGLTERFQTMFTPSKLCVSNEIFNETEVGQPVVMMGKAHEHIGFFIETIMTPSDLEKLAAKMQEMKDESEETPGNQATETNDTEEASTPENQ